jgi:hypothetical protein
MPPKWVLISYNSPHPLRPKPPLRGNVHVYDVGSSKQNIVEIYVLGTKLSKANLNAISVEVDSSRFRDGGRLFYPEEHHQRIEAIITRVFNNAELVQQHDSYATNLAWEHFSKILNLMIHPVDKESISLRLFELFETEGETEMEEIVTGTYGDVPIVLNKKTGILKMADKQGVLFRVKLINRLFGSIITRQFYSILVKDAGRAMGEDYAIHWLLTNLKEELPQELAEFGEKLRLLEEKAEEDSMNPERLSQDRIQTMQQYSRDLESLTSEIKEMISNWLRNEEGGRIRDFWQRMHDEDVYAGWGRAELTSFNHKRGQAEIQMTTSYIARLFYYWDQMGKTGQKVCSILEGYFLGEAEVMLVRDDLVCVEKECRLQGAEKCTFIIKPEELLTQVASKGG